MKSWFTPTIENAPCPPFFVDNVYEIFINQTQANNLTSEVVEDIRKKCSIEIPTTTTTTTTSTSTSTTTTATPEPSTSPISPTTNETVTESANVTTTTDTSFNDTVTETTITSVSSTHTTTQHNQSSSEIVTNETTTSVPKSTVPTTELTYNTTVTTSENVTLSNVTIITGTVNEPAYARGCNTICIIGIATGAVCLCLLLLLIIALATLFRKGRDSKTTRSRSRSRSRFGDMPDVDLYDSVDIEGSPSSKRNSGSSLFRRSGDFSRSPPVVFDNPAYRRSFELRPHRYNSWYDPDATDYSYSQINANLINIKSRSPERRSVSTSRLHDKHAPEHHRHGSSSSWHSSIREYVPKMLNSSSEGDFGQSSPYYYSSQNGLLHNSSNNSPSQRTLPRTPIETRGKHKEIRPKFSRSQRLRSYDPDMSGGSGSWDDSHFISMDNSRSRSQYIKNNKSKKSTTRSKRDKHKKVKEKRQNDIEIPFDRIYRTNSENRNNHLPIQYPNNSSYKGNSPSIISSNLHPVSFKYNGPSDGYGRNRCRSNSDRSPDVDDYYTGQGRSFRDRSSDNSRRYSSRQSSYKPDSNEIYMFQTKL